MSTAQLAPREQAIIDKLDRKAVGDLMVGSSTGGMKFKDMSEVLEFAKLMSVSLQAVPKHCRNQPGVCLGIAIQAIEWRMSPYAVAQKSYVVNDVISYESQLIHAVVEQRSPIACRLRHKFIGSGGKRQCIVWATAKGEAEALEYTSPEFDKITPKNSPLWKTKPDLQLFYNASRDWARMYFPDVIMGVYADDELESMPGSQAVDRPRGIAGLKQQLTGPPEDSPADEEPPEPVADESIDPPAPDDIGQTVPGGDESQEPQMSAEEQAEMERLREEHAPVTRGKQKSAFDNTEQYK